MSVTPDEEFEGRVRGRAAGLQRQFRAKFLMIVAGTLMVGLLLSLVVATSNETNGHFNATFFLLFFALFIMLGALYALIIWWRYRSTVRRFPKTMARNVDDNAVTSTRLGAMYARGSLGPSPTWEKPSVAGESNFNPNRPPDYH